MISGMAGIAGGALTGAVVGSFAGPVGAVVGGVVGGVLAGVGADIGYDALPKGVTSSACCWHCSPLARWSEVSRVGAMGTAGVLLLLGSPALLVISFVAWGEALYVAPAQADGHWVQVGVASTNAPRFERTSRLWTQPELAQAPNVAVQGRWLAVHPALLYWSLRYYYEHPEARAELADERAVQRIRTGALLD